MLTWFKRMALNPDAIARADVAEGNRKRLRHGFHSGKSTDAVVDFAEEFAAAWFLVSDLLHVHGQINYMIRVETEVDLLSLFQAADK